MRSKWLTFSLLLCLAWVTMISVHEIGHVIGGWIGGAALVDLDIRPWKLPYSLHSPDPIPLLTLWSGPVLGCVVPIGVAFCCRNRHVWFVADFCVLANGCYLALAWFSGDRYLDTPQLFSAGASKISVVLFCVPTILFGYFRFRADCVEILMTAPHEQSPRNKNKDVGGESR